MNNEVIDILFNNFVFNESIMLYILSHLNSNVLISHMF